MWQALVPAAVKGVSAVGRFVADKIRDRNRPARPSFEGSPYGRDLLRLGEEGISNEEQARRLGRTSRAAGTAAARGKADAAARVKRDMQTSGSIAANRDLNTFDTGVARTVASEAGRIAGESELIKREAKDRYGRLAFQDQLAGYADDMREHERDGQQLNQLIGGVAGAVGTGFRDHLAFTADQESAGLAKEQAAANLALTKAKTAATLAKETGFQFPANFGQMDEAGRIQFYIGQGIKDPDLMDKLTWIFDRGK